MAAGGSLLSTCCVAYFSRKSATIRNSDSLCFTPINHLSLIYPRKVLQNGWRRLEHEEVLAPAPVEESGAGMDRGEESCQLDFFRSGFVFY